jgi:hypothetical protein
VADNWVYQARKHTKKDCQSTVHEQHFGMWDSIFRWTWSLAAVLAPITALVGIIGRERADKLAKSAVTHSWGRNVLVTFILLIIMLEGCVICILLAARDFLLSGNEFHRIFSVSFWVCAIVFLSIGLFSMIVLEWLTVTGWIRPRRNAAKAPSELQPSPKVEGTLGLIYLDTAFVIETYEAEKNVLVPIRVVKKTSVAAKGSMGLISTGATMEEQREFPFSSRKMLDDLENRLKQIPTIDLDKTLDEDLPEFFWTEGIFCGSQLDSTAVFRLQTTVGDSDPRNVLMITNETYFASGYAPGRRLVTHQSGYASRGSAYRSRDHFAICWRWAPFSPSVRLFHLERM